jgi:hypothetical protein
MRKAITTATTLLTTAVLLTGCGSGGDGSTSSESKAPSASSASGAPDPSASGAAGSAAGETHQVTLEVKGSGKGQVLWTAGDNGMDQVDLPWKKQTTVTLKGAELKLGAPLSVVPQAVQDANARFVFPACTITVDGKQVAHNEDEDNAKGCTYLLKSTNRP